MDQPSAIPPDETLVASRDWIPPREDDAREPVPLNIPPARYGAVDRIHGRWIDGWAFDPRRPTDRLNLIVLLDGEVSGFAAADQFRQDLLENAIGDGGHGFRAELPARKLRGARLITIVAERDGGLEFIHEQHRHAMALAASTMAPDRITVHFDISDLLFYLWHHQGVTGIQRVQCGYLSNILAARDEGFTFRVCAQNPGDHHFVELANDRVAALLLAIEAKRMLPFQDWRDYIEAERLGTGRTPHFRPGDIILTMGAPWVHPEYFDAIEMVKAAYGVRYMQIFYDLIPTIMPETVTSELIRDFTKSIAGMIGCVDHIFAISHSSDSDLRKACALLNVDCPPMSVIPLGATIDYRDNATMPPATPLNGSSPRDKYGDYVLCVGTIEPRKNHIYLYNVWKRMLQEIGPETPRLVCIGRMGWHAEELQRYLAATGNLDGHFIHLSEVSDADLARFYADCLFTVFPSFYEGWGLPVVESLFYRKLCVASNASAIPEAGGDWVVYVDPRSTSNGFEVISDLVRDAGRMADHERRLRERYEPRTWHAATRALIQAISSAIANEPSHPSSPPQDLRADCIAGRRFTRSLHRIKLRKIYRFSSALPVGGPLGILLAQIDLREATLLLHGDDWHAIEDWGCWACGPEARLCFIPPDDAATEFICYMSVRLPHYFGSLGCDVLVDGIARGRVSLANDGFQEICLSLSCEAGGAGAPRRPITIMLRTETLIRPPPGSLDKRLLGPAVRSLCVFAVDDQAGRLAYLESRAARLVSGVSASAGGASPSQLNAGRAASTSVA